MKKTRDHTIKPKLIIYVNEFFHCIGIYFRAQSCSHKLLWAGWASIEFNSFVSKNGSQLCLHVFSFVVVRTVLRWNKLWIWQISAITSQLVLNLMRWASFNFKEYLSILWWFTHILSLFAVQIEINVTFPLKLCLVQCANRYKCSTSHTFLTIAAYFQI